MQQINLYRPIFRKQEKKFSAVAMLQAGGLIAVGIAVIAGLMVWQVHGLQARLTQSERHLASATQQFDEHVRKFGPQSGEATVELRIAQLEQQLSARQRMVEVLTRGLFSNTTGYSGFFTAFARQRVSGVWLTGFDIVGAGEEMELQGRTIDPAQVPRYMQRLSTEAVMNGRAFQEFVMARPKKEKDELEQPSYIEFRLRTSWSKDEGKS